MKRKIFAILLVFALMIGVTSMVDFSVKAAIHVTLFVGGVEVTEQNATDVFGDGTVSFDYETNTLTLNNATITEYYTEEWFGEDCKFGIYCESNSFNLQLLGENTIYLNNEDDTCNAIYTSGALNVSGNGALSVTSFSGIVAMGKISVKDCSLEFSGTGVVSMDKISFENVTLEAFAAIMAYNDVTVKSSTIIAGESAVTLEEGGSLSVEDSSVTIANSRWSSPISVTKGNVAIKNSTLNFNVNAVDEDSAMGILAGNQLTLENVQANIELRSNAGYALMGMAKVTISKSNLTLSAVSLEDSAIGITSSGNITIEESILEIDVRGGDDLSAAIGTMNGKAEIKDSTLKLTTSGNSVVGVLGVNIVLINCNGFVKVMAVGEGELMGACLGTIEGTLTINGGVLNIEATGSVDSDAFGILIEGATPPTFIDANITIRGSGAASIYAPNLNSYGREYTIEASEDIDCDTPAEYNPENIHDYKYLYIHGWYTVTFDANGGTGTMESGDGLCGSFILPNNLFNAPEGKQFKGWAYSADGETIQKMTIEVLQDVTLYAIWEDVEASPENPEEPEQNPNDPEHNHVYGKDWVKDATGHHKACSCGKKQYEGAHVDTNNNSSCDVCGYQMPKAKEKGCKGSIDSCALTGLAILATACFFVRKRKHL